MADNRVRSIVARSVGCAVASLIVWGLVPESFAQGAVAATSSSVWESKRIDVNVDQMPLEHVLRVIAQQAGLVPVFEKTLIPSSARVTLHLPQVSVGAAFQRALLGTGLIARIGVEGDVVITRLVDAAVDGSIIGKVVDARTRQPLRDAKISVDGVSRAETGGDGGYRIGEVSVGAHTVAIKLLGYSRQTHLITVADDQTVTLDVVLEGAVTPLNQVVVTGTVIPTELKAIPNSITVITAQELDQRGITHIDQLFRGDVPGLFVMNQGSNGVQPGQISMSSRGSTYLPNTKYNGGGISVGGPLAQTIKTYVDGVELADPSYLAMIDPKSIERIEILSGPQASTIYGSNAINGVMQVFTKRGASAATKPQLTVRLMSGLIQNNFTPAVTPQHDYSAQLSGVDGHLSYSAGGGWLYMGPWTPSVHTTTVNGNGGVRFQQNSITMDVSLRRTLGTNWQNGDPQQRYNTDKAQGIFFVVGGGSPVPVTNHSIAQTLGMTATYAPVSWWSQTLTIGTDETDTDDRSTGQAYSSTSDTLLSLKQTSATRTSLAYTTTGRMPLTSEASLIVTAGADGWHSTSTSLAVQTGTTLSGTLSISGTPTIRRQPSHDHGAFGQLQLGVLDKLFVTYGVRAEWNPNYGSDANPNLVPRYGFAYTEEVGPVTAKLRASYGSSTRPPYPAIKDEITLQEAGAASLIYRFGNIAFVLANPDLVPERQHGGEGGLDLYWGNRGSLSITRYDQRVDNLINQAITDSVIDQISIVGLGRDPAQYPEYPGGYDYYTQYQNINIGSIRNDGWEAKGTLNAGPFSANGTYSWSKSRIIGVNPKYRVQFPTLVPGGTFTSIPEHTWAAGLRYAQGGTTVGLDVQGIGFIWGTFADALRGEILSSRLLTDRPRFTLPSNYAIRSPGYAQANINATIRLSSAVDCVAQVQNVADSYRSEQGDSFASIGRQTEIGLRVRW